MPKLAIVPEERLLSGKEASAILGVSMPTIYGFMNSGELGYVMIGKRRRIRQSALMAFIAQSEQRGPREEWVFPRRRQAEG